jgi:FixJ family two-component response regulator
MNDNDWSKHTVYLVDDDASFLRAAARVLTASGFTVSTHSSVKGFLADWNPDTPGCIVSDLRMPEMGGLDLQRALAKTATPMPILFLTGQGDIVTTVQAMRGGAEDFLEKRAPLEHLLDAVQRALLRDVHERSARARHAALRAAFAALTVREREVLEQVVRGRLNKQIAADLGIHERTVKLHRMAMMTKLGAHSVAELTRLTQAAGLLEPLTPP